MHPHAEDLAVVAQRHLAFEVDVAPEPGGDQVAGLVLDPLDGSLEQNRREDRRDVAGVHRDLVAETAPEIGGDDADHVLGDLGHERHCCADDVWRLGRHVDGELATVARSIVGDRSAGLDRRRVRPRVVHVDFGDRSALAKARSVPLAIPDLPVEDDVVVLVDLSSRISGAPGARPAQG